MSKELGKNLELALKRVALESSPFGAVDGKWDSSAQKLDNDLSEHGVKLPRNLFHNYALPMKHQKFMEQIAILDFLKDVDISDIKDIVRYDGLNALEKIKLATYVLFKRKEAQKKLDEYFEFIRSANPELGKLKVINDVDKQEIVRGVLFGFGPDEIAYLGQKRRHEFTREQLERDGRLEGNFNIRLKKLGISKPQYVLSPKTMQTIMAALPVKPLAMNPKVRTI